jgi:predicted NBD/HSP70 family sugar kinase
VEVRSLRGATAARGSNRARVLAALRTLGTASRADLARATGLAPSTVSTIVADLREQGLVSDRGRHGDAPSAAGGRPPDLIGFDASAGVAVGLDFGKRHLGVAVADLSHAVLAEKWEDMPADYAATDGMDRAVDLLDQVLEEAGAERARVLGVGMGLPGPIHRSGALGSSAILPGWIGLKARDDMEARLGLRVTVENDANLGALAEHAWGAGRGARSIAYLKLSTGIGAGLVLDGRLFRGAGGTAGEIGHMTVDEHGDICRCGNRGCLETVAAGPAIVALMRRSLGAELEIGDVLDRAEAGDAASRRVLGDAARHVGVAVANLCNLVNPERIVVGGSIGRTGGDAVLEPLRESVRLRAIPSAAEDVKIVAAALGARAELLGTVALVLQQNQWIDPKGGAS